MDAFEKTKQLEISDPYKSEYSPEADSELMYRNSPAATNTLLENMMEFMQQEKQDRIKSDKKNFWLTVGGIVLMAATLIATIWFGLG